MFEGFSQYVLAKPYFNWLLQGVFMTLTIACITTLLSCALGFSAALCRNSKRKILSAPAFAYIHFFRATPVLPLLLLIVIGGPEIYKQLTGNEWIRNSEFILFILILSCNTSAYLAEILRSGIRSVPNEQIEIARTLGLTANQTFIRITLPIAIRVSIYAIGNRLIHNMKNASLSMALSINVSYLDILGQADRIESQTFRWVEPLLVAAGIYLSLALLLQFLLKRYCNKKLNQAV